MEKKEIWIPDIVGRVQRFEFSELEGLIKVDVDEYPGIITDYIFDGKALRYDPEKTEVERLKQENEELRQRVDMSDEALLELADMVLSATAAMKGGN